MKDTRVGFASIAEMHNAVKKTVKKQYELTGEANIRAIIWANQAEYYLQGINLIDNSLQDKYKNNSNKP